MNFITKGLLAYFQVPTLKIMILKQLVPRGFSLLFYRWNRQNFNPDPPIYALKFCPVPGFTSILGIANEDGNIAFQDTDKVCAYII